MAALGAGKTDACRAANHFNEGWVSGYGRGSIFENDDSSGKVWLQNLASYTSIQKKIKGLTY